MIDKAIHFLERLHQLFSSPERHTTKEAARNRDGDVVMPISPHAVCWCLIGGQMRIAHEMGLATSSPVVIKADGALLDAMDALTVSGNASHLGINEDGSTVYDLDGKLVTGRLAILRVCNHAIQTLRAEISSSPLAA